MVGEVADLIHVVKIKGGGKSYLKIKGGAIIFSSTSIIGTCTMYHVSEEHGIPSSHRQVLVL